MEIGPVEAIHPVGQALPVRPSPALDRVFAAEFRRQQHDPSQTPNRRASRGLEDESPEDDPEAEPSAPDPDSTINFFA